MNARLLLVLPPSLCLLGLIVGIFLIASLSLFGWRNSRLDQRRLIGCVLMFRAVESKRPVAKRFLRSRNVLTWSVAGLIPAC